MVPPKKGESRARIVLRLLAHRLARIGPVFAGVFVSVVLALYFIERGLPDSKFTSLADAFWFCVVTMSTVGYGDIFPVSGLGRVITGLFILFTLGTGACSHRRQRGDLEVKREESGSSHAHEGPYHCVFNSMPARR